MTISPITTSEEMELAKQVVVDSFSESPDAGLDEWLSFEEMLSQIEEKRGLGLLAKEGDNPVGMIYAQQENPVNSKEGTEKWVVIVAGVVPESTGSGVGTTLLKALEGEVKNRGGVKMFIFTNDDDEQVINFYKKNGYKDAGYIKDYQYGKDNTAVFLLKYL